MRVLTAWEVTAFWESLATTDPQDQPHIWPQRNQQPPSRVYRNGNHHLACLPGSREGEYHYILAVGDNTSAGMFIHPPHHLIWSDCIQFLNGVLMINSI